jgi:hypothetical protein
MSPVPTTAGMPYSRATREAWAARVPPSVAMAAARANIGDQDVAIGERGEVLGSVHDAGGTGGPAGGGGMPDDDSVTGEGRASGLLHGAVDGVADQPGRSAQRRWCGESALSLPGGAPFRDARGQSDGLTVQALVEFVAGAEEHVVGVLDRGEGDQAAAEAAGAGAQDRPGEGEVAGLLLPDHGVPLIDRQQLPELVQQRGLAGEGGVAALLGGGSVRGEVGVPAVPGGRSVQLQFCGYPVIPVDALDGMRAGDGFGAGQPAQEYLGAAVAVG